MDLRRWRAALTVVVVLVLLLAIGLGAGGWYYTDELLPAAVPGEAATDVEVVAIDGDTVTLRPAGAPAYDVADLDGDLVLGFQHLSGYLRLTGDPVEGVGGAVRRDYRVLTGTPPAVGDRGDVQATAFPDDPTVLARPVEDVTAAGPLGDLPGWFLPGDGEAGQHVVVLVHGRGARRSDMLRAAEVVATGGTGASVLVVSHRNDVDAPPSPDGFGHYGDTEWADLQAWLTWLDGRAPGGITLFGASQGGSVVAACLVRCADTSDVTGVVLDSPLLSMDATLVLQAAGRDIPGPLIRPLLVATKAVSTVRGGPDFARLEHVATLAGLDLPILVFHGTADTTVPFAPSEALADADPAQVTFERSDVEHVRAWNADPEAYAAAVTTFLEATIP